ncbi:lactosylceramide 1,3-N-acetyl-beta-D-glucosaminyltransferase A-like [Copidosoma floridanum]|uniref:lactosylceramide 1,3-N-acetyl-beta-D-glucosaminyltransferase A-like n=1 Tax=Copidosoma floridanum TaxID=29053 RepID=UPI0006C986EC|nr:lactosylceramide 1,3-N-acetyl-beta-D-glucosaminyltransferase A-like [Copidosoma floridanum]
MPNKKRLILFIFHVTIFHMCLFCIGYISSCFVYKFFENALSSFGNIKKSVTLLKNNSIIDLKFFNKSTISNDKLSLIDINNFQFTINHHICNQTQPYLLMLIHSAPANLNKRNVIRETWGQQISSTITLFLVGFSGDYEAELVKENVIHKDLIQGSFLDDYKNITYKHVMALKWVTYHCSNAKYVLKLDDDVFVYVPALISFLKKDHGVQNGVYHQKNILEKNILLIVLVGRFCIQLKLYIFYIKKLKKNPFSG